MEYKVKEIRRICWGYGLILVITNLLGVLLPSSGNVPVSNTDFIQGWLQFIADYKPLIICSYIVAFSLPAFLCHWYLKCDENKFCGRFIDIPLTYSLIGTTGWFFSFFLELIFLLYAKKLTGIIIYPIIFTSAGNMFQEGLFIFTLSFLILDTLHRKYVLPKYFPEGNLSQYRGTKNPSTKILFIVFFMSVSVFPIDFLTSTILVMHQNYNIPVNSSVFVIVGFLGIFGIIMLITLTNSFASPLKKLKEGTERVKEGDYSHKVGIVSNDAFGDLADNFNDMITSLDEKTKRIYASQESFIKGMAIMVESRDNSTGGHINRTSDCVRVFVNKLCSTPEYADLDKDFCKRIIKAAPMHDLGKIAVDDAILRKPGKFTPEEYEQMKKHSAEGARIVETVLVDTDDEKFKKVAVNVAHYHHEKWDGSGYPNRISGEDIPYEARIMALADVFDALVSKRCYKDSFTYDKAFEIIQDSLGSHFDPTLGKIFIACRDDLEELYKNY